MTPWMGQGLAGRFRLFTARKKSNLFIKITLVQTKANERKVSKREQ